MNRIHSRSKSSCHFFFFAKKMCVLKRLQRVQNLSVFTIKIYFIEKYELVSKVVFYYISIKTQLSFTCYNTCNTKLFMNFQTFIKPKLRQYWTVHSGKQVGKNPFSKSRNINIFLFNLVWFIPGDIMIPFIDILNRTK